MHHDNDYSCADYISFQGIRLYSERQLLMTRPRYCHTEEHQRVTQLVPNPLIMNLSCRVPSMVSPWTSSRFRGFARRRALNVTDVEPSSFYRGNSTDVGNVRLAAVVIRVKRSAARVGYIMFLAHHKILIPAVPRMYRHRAPDREAYEKTWITWTRTRPVFTRVLVWSPGTQIRHQKCRPPVGGLLVVQYSACARTRTFCPWPKT